MKIGKILAAAAAAILISAAPAAASSVHLKGGANAEPSFADLGLSLSASGELSGLGNGDVLVTLAATGNPTSTCGNPGTNKWQAPGQNPASVTLTGTQAIPDSQIKNGNTPFGPVITDEPESPVPGAPDCPNSSWTELITDVAFTGAVITVEQPPGTVVLTVTCTIDPPSADGAISKNAVSCTSS
ncbi:hypothetical protein OO014_19140 [Intrasporangium calvum]|uniref:Secreted protein n=1 Tax=Intrasporangium calvum TaxID=53358 RepID=A0ABT5GNA8_9MICO|nr:hypothetical protein [Intrasporangium calvum]MDC5699370.1 hypothetical protein [Intrasporangium calvum]